MKNNFIQIIALGAAGVALLASCGGTREKSDNWAWLGFERAATAPILEPDSTARFLCPMRGDSVAWMESDVFNPAAAVKGDSIVPHFAHWLCPFGRWREFHIFHLAGALSRQ